MKKNVLLVDDDYIFSYLNQKVLEKMGIANEIRSVLNGKEALNLLNDSHPGAQIVPDVIFLDLNMPIMGGFAFLEAFKNLNIPHKERISIIVVTSSQDPEDIQHAKAMGADHYLSKPLSEEAIRTVLAT